MATVTTREHPPNVKAVDEMTFDAKFLTTTTVAGAQHTC
jgi:hypothetical protein